MIDWRQVHDGDDGDYHHDPVPPDPQTRYLNPQRTLPGGVIALGFFVALVGLVGLCAVVGVFLRP